MRSLCLQTPVVVLEIVLVLLSVGSIGAGMVIRTGSAPPFDQRIALHTQYSIVIHNGPTCWLISNPSQHACVGPGSEQRAFFIDYLTPDGVRSLVWFGLP